MGERVQRADRGFTYNGKNLEEFKMLERIL
jgi:hypothetical protein